MSLLDPRIQKNELVYLAGPYSSKSWELVKIRALVHIKIAAMLIAEGYMCFSPIAHSHPIWLAESDLPSEAGFWGRYNQEWLRCCKHLIVVTMTGWEESKGTRLEMLFARQNGIPIYMLEPPAEAQVFALKDTIFR